MRKLKLLFAALALLVGGAGSASAATENKTASVAAWTGSNYTSATDGIVLNENYVGSTTSTGNIFSQTIDGLAQGYYKLTLYANAIYTPERGFNSDASDFDSDCVFIFATGNNITTKTAVPVKYGIITTGSEAYSVNAYVGADGKLTIGMTKDKGGTNWHTIATKSLIFYGNDLSTIKEELNTEIATATGLSVAASETAKLNAAIAEAQSIYDNGTATFDEVDAAITALKIAEKYAQGGFSSATLDNPVPTDFVENGDFTSFTSDWPNGGWYTTAGVGNHGQMTEGSEKAWENYSWGNEKLSGKMYFRMTDIPNGAYSVSIDGFSRTASSTYAYANKERVYLTANETYETKVIPVIVKNNMLEIGLYSGKIDWMKIKKVSVSYTGDPLASYKNTIKTLIETGEALDLTGIPTNVSSTMTSAISTYKPVYSAYTEEAQCTGAINALQPVVEKAQAYVSAKAAIDKMNSILAATNLYTDDAYTTFTSYITKFNNGEYTTEEANALNGVVFGTGWRSTAAVDDFLISAWDVAARTWDSYHVNTWSTTGDSGNPNFLTPCIEYWIGDASTLGDKVLTATLSNFTPGAEYKVTAKVCLGVNTGVDASTAPVGITLQLNDGAATSVCTGSRITTTRFYESEFEASGMIGIDGKLNVKLNVASTNVSWMTIRDVKYEKTADAVAASSDDLDALDAAILAKGGKTLGFEKDEYAPYTNVEVIKALATAQDARANHTDSKLVITTATTALTGATWTANVGEVNAISNGMFSGSSAATIQSSAYNGWTSSGNNGIREIFTSASYPGLNDATNNAGMYVWGSQTYAYGNTVGYTMPLKANTIYEFNIKFAGQSGAFGNLDASILNASTGMAVQSIGGAAKGVNEAGSLVSYSIKFVTGAAGNYVLSLSPNGNAVFTDMTITKAANQYLEFADNAVMPTYAPGTYPTVKITRTLTAGNWATAVYPFAVSGVDNIAVLNSYDASTGALGFTSAAASTANVPFLMKSATDKSEISLTDVVVAAANATDATDATDGKASLKGVYASTPITNAAKNYVLSNNKIYSVGTAGATIPAYRAYIQIDQSTPAPLFFTVDGETTGINMVQGEGSKVNGEVYDLQGRKVAKPAKGLYIQNGRKVMIK